MTCDRCQFYEETANDTHSGSTHGHCHRFPPQLSANDVYSGSFFPKVRGDDWCGEFTPYPHTMEQP